MLIMGQLHRRFLPLQQLKNSLSSLVHNPLSILSNPYTAWTSLLAMFGALFADALGKGYLGVLGVAGLLFIYGIWDELRKTNIYQHDAIPLPVVINIANPASSQNALNCLFNIIEKDHRYRNHRKHLAQYLTLEASDLVFDYSGDIHNLEMLKDFLKITRHNLERLKGKTPKNTTLYLAYIGPASVGILVGTMLGTDSVKIFQYSKSSDSYYEAINIQDRRLKETISAFEKFQISRQPDSPSQPRLTVAIDVAAHKIKLNDLSIKTYGDLIYMASQSNGTIQASEDWLQYCQEIFTVLNSAQQSYDEIRLIYSMPVALAVALGCALQNYWKIMLTNYDSTNNTYRDLMLMNDLRYFF
jgi:hypothetical protein